MPYSGKPRLLIIEDNPASAGGLAEMARRCRYQTLIASNPQTGLEIAGWWQPDVVMVDLSILDEDLFAASRSIRRVLEKNRQLVALSGTEVGKSELEEGGFDRVLVKPVTFEAFSQSLPNAPVGRNRLD